MITAATLRKAIVRVMDATPTPFTLNQLCKEVKRIAQYDYSEKEVFETLCDLTMESELLDIDDYRQSDKYEGFYDY